MKILDIIILALFVGLVFGCTAEKNNGVADLTLINGKIWTVDPDKPWAEAVAIQKEKIIKVGSTEEIKKLCDETTREFDLK